MKKVELNYFQIEPRALTADDRWQDMTATERGVNHTINVYLFLNDGKWKLDSGKIRRLSNYQGPDTDWDRILDKVLERYKITRGFIRSETVTASIERARGHRQQRVDAANKRWEKEHAAAHADAHAAGDAAAYPAGQPPQTKGKGNANGKSSKAKNTERKKKKLAEILMVYDKIIKIIPVRSESDQTTLKSILEQVFDKIDDETVRAEQWDRIAQFAFIASSKKKPWAYFTQTAKKQLGWKPENSKKRNQKTC